LADGIVDELITMLGQVPQFRIAGRTSSFQFKDAKSPVTEIAARLNVSHLLEGAVQRQEDQLRINVSLIDGVTGFEVWSDSFDGSMDDVFAAREDIGRAIANGLIGSLNLTARDVRPRTLTKSREAYGLYLQGRALTLRAIGEGVLDTAKDFLTRALEIDPNFAECWTALAEAHVYTCVFTPCRDKLAEAESMAECAKRAMALSPNHGHARAILGLYKWTQNDVVGALDLAYEAYFLEPQNPAVTMRLGSFLLYCGRTEAALPYILTAIDQDPVDGRNYAMLCTAYLNLGRIDEAISAGQRMVDLGQISLHLAIATAAFGHRELAVQQYQKTRLLMNTVIFPPVGSTPMSPEAMDAYWKMAAEGIHSGCEDARRQYCQILDMLHVTLPDTCDPTIVLPAIWMGYSEMVFKTLGTQITPPNMVGLMSLWVDIEPIRQTRMHPDFMDFAAEIGLVAAWEKYGWPDFLPDPRTEPKTFI
jgi:TolB-like protein/Tfp pilus assembly protein PilF